MVAMNFENLRGRILLKFLLRVIWCSLFIYFLLACRMGKSKSSLVGEWVQFKIERIDKPSNELDLLGADTLLTIKYHFEFDPDGSGRELTFEPDIEEFTYNVDADQLYLGNRRYLIERLTRDTLILLVPDRFEKNKFRERIYFESIK